MNVIQAALSPLSTSFTVKRILVPTDFSPHSEAALKQAAAIARLHSAEVLMVNVLPPEPAMRTPLEPANWEYETLKDQAQQEFAGIEHGGLLDGIPHRSVIEVGPLERMLKAVIEAERIDLVIAGTHGRTGIKKLLLGSVAEEIFRVAPCPVLTVGPDVWPRMLTHGKFESILYATDFSASSDGALRHAITFAEESQAKMTLLHVVEEGSVTAIYLHQRLVEDAKSRLERMIPSDARVAAPAIVVESGYPAEEILKWAEKVEADLIVLGVRKGGEIAARTSAHLPWTIAHTVVCHARCPVLTVRG